MLRVDIDIEMSLSLKQRSDEVEKTSTNAEKPLEYSPSVAQARHMSILGVLFEMCLSQLNAFWKKHSVNFHFEAKIATEMLR